MTPQNVCLNEYYYVLYISRGRTAIAVGLGLHRQ